MENLKWLDYHYSIVGSSISIWIAGVTKMPANGVSIGGQILT